MKRIIPLITTFMLSLTAFATENYEPKAADDTMVV